MSEMVERVTAALRDAFRAETKIATLPLPVRRRLARAAIVAMWEPTEAMAETGDAVIAHGADEYMQGNARTTWCEMVDEALR